MSVIPLLRTVPRPMIIAWGGRRLESWVPDLPEGPVGEAWMACGLPGRSTLVHGEGIGLLPLDTLCSLPGDPLGCAGAEFPLLLKIIDAHSTLSVQVHPTRPAPGILPKTECWLILDAPAGAVLYAGLRQAMAPHDLMERLKTGDVDALDPIPVRTGDCVFIPSGTVHAITGGLLVAELQQSSDTTYRIWDWGRLGLDGKPRQLHQDEALHAIDPAFRRGLRVSGLNLCEGRRIRCACPQLALAEIVPRTPLHLAPTSRVRIVMCIEAGRIQSETAIPGATFLVPRGRIVELEGGRWLEGWVPDLGPEIVNPAQEVGHSRSAIAALGAFTWDPAETGSSSRNSS